MSDLASSGSRTRARGPRQQRRERLLLLGLTSCDQAIARRLMASGHMPHLARLRTDCAWARLLPSEPLIGRSLWTAVATGRDPAVHDVMAPFVPRPDGGGVMPIGQKAWRAPAFWQVLEAAGHPTITVGWPATAPATAWPGIHVDARFAAASGPDFSTWAVPRGAVSPAALTGLLRAARVHPADVTGAMLAPFVPEIAGIDQYRESGLVHLAMMLAGASTMHGAATELMAVQDWDVMAVHYDWLDFVQQSFLCVDAASRFGGVVDAAYAFADALLGRLMELAGEDTTIWVVSPNGVRAGAAMALRGGGFIATRGRWIEPGKTLDPMRLVDIAPSLLARFGLVSETDGKKIFALAPGMSRRTVTVPLMPRAATDRDIAALRALGYDDAPNAAQSAALIQAEADGLLAQGDALLAGGRPREAEAAILAARAMLPPDNPGGLRRLALCRLLRGDAESCRQLGEILRRIEPDSGWGDLIVAGAHALDGNAPAARPYMIVARERGGHEPEMESRLGAIALMLKEDQSAVAHFQAALALDPDMEGARKGLEMARELGRRV
jgi:tetratricopeptide (TPR) repeat protein